MNLQRKHSIPRWFQYFISDFLLKSPTLEIVLRVLVKRRGRFIPLRMSSFWVLVQSPSNRHFLGLFLRMMWIMEAMLSCLFERFSLKDQELKFLFFVSIEREGLW